MPTPAEPDPFVVPPGGVAPRVVDPFVAPRYGERSLADLLGSVYAVLGAGGADPLGLADRLPGVRRVVLLLADGLGAGLLPLAAPAAPALAAAVALPPLTCGFPSTTPTSLVSLGVGAPPGRHGVVGFTVRLPGTDRLFTHIRWDADVDPRAWQPLDSCFDRGRAAGVPGWVVGPASFAGSGLTDAAYRGAGYLGARGTGQIVSQVAGALAAADRGVVYVYRPEIDRAGHLSGPGSAPWLAAVAAVDEVVAGIAAVLPADAALLVTADHGMVRVGDADRIDLDGQPALLAGTRVIAGEGRARYVHAEPGAAGDVLATWRELLTDRAEVVSRQEAIAAGWYGPTSPAAAERIGDVVAACRGRSVLVRTVEEPTESRFLGYHGSLTAVEMTVPLLLVRPAG
ncbi:alkaline phosphatase family protein [Actinocatenispora thailandica]|uniref:Alkaline phosphatase family protein n=1 Tax=Actinocatenispora thailandica TaxID=227318 RepID=A0A7R7HWJ1_9ACTN|nr:alkaline phosphatase family protein [Actinocatenispora thailandica]BCJ34938.1 alkaline phosphatase family protein [Actinocatenispora thailandica]